MATVKHVVSVILTNSRGEVLLQQRDDKPGLPYAAFWTLFGGQVEDGEDNDTAIRRELQEELALDIPLRYWQTVICPARSITGELTVYNHTYLAELMQPVEELTLYEGQAMAYFDAEAARNMPLAFDQHLILRAYLDER